MVGRFLFGLILCLLSASGAQAAATPLWFSTGVCLQGGPVPPTPKTILGSFPVNVQSGASYTLSASDVCKLVRTTNAGAVALTLSTPSTSYFPNKSLVFIQVSGAGGATITPSGATIDGASSLVLTQNDGVIVFSDGTNYHTLRGITRNVSGSITINGTTCTIGSTCTVTVTCAQVTDAGTACTANTGQSGHALPFLDQDNVWSAHQEVSPVALTDGATITPNGTDANAYTLSLAGNGHTLAAPTTVKYGVYAFQITNSSGATGFATSTAYKFSGGSQPSWSTTAGAIDVLTCQVFDPARLECAAILNEKNP